MLTIYIISVIIWAIIWLYFLIREIYNGGGYPVLPITIFLLFSPLWPVIAALLIYEEFFR